MNIKSFIQKWLGIKTEEQNLNINLSDSSASKLAEQYFEAKEAFEKAKKYAEEKEAEKAKSMKFPAGSTVYFLDPSYDYPLAGRIIGKARHFEDSPIPDGWLGRAITAIEDKDIYVIKSFDAENSEEKKVHEHNIFFTLPQACSEYLRRAKHKKIILDSNIEAVTKILNEEL